MVDQAIAASPRTSAMERYLETETRLWQHYGLAPQNRFVEIARPHARLRVLDVGSGRPVLFVHGTIGPGAWAPLIGSMPGVRSIVIDRPGWGLSGPVDFARHEYRAFVADILRGVLDGLGIDRIDVVGGSIGDVWALSLAEHHPDRVGRIVLLGGGPLVAEVQVPGFIRLIRSPIGALIVRLPVSADRFRSILRQTGHGPSLDAGRIPDEMIDWRVALANDTVSMRHERAMVRSILGRSGWRPGFAFDDRDLGGIAHPTLMVYGTADPTGDPDLWRGVMRALPHGELEMMDGAGHEPWFEDAERVAGRVQGFLA
jgi:pimeloyl-ACP methyl ester carboxylesterase